MALIWTDSFNLVDSVKPQRWLPGATAAAGGRSVSVVSGRHGNGADVSGGSYNVCLDPSADDDLVIIGFALKPIQFGTSPSARFLWIGEYRVVGATATQFRHLHLESTGSTGVIAVRKTLGGADLGTFTVVPSAWQYVEVKVRIHDTAGTVVVRVDGVEVLNLSGQDTRDNTAGTTGLVNAFGFNVGTASSNSQVYDDLYACNEQGSVNNDFLGDVTVELLHPTAAGGSTGWTPSAGSNYACVDETNTDFTDYVSSSATGDKDLYTLGNSSAVAPQSIAGVAVYAVAGKTDTGSRSIATVANLSGTDVQGDDLTLLDVVVTGTTAKAQTARQFLDVKPGGGAWSITDVDNLEAGVVCRP